MLLCFGGVDYKAVVWLNDEYVGEYESGETPFRFDVTDQVKPGEENIPAVKVINPIAKDIYGLNMVNIPNRNKQILQLQANAVQYRSGARILRLWMMLFGRRGNKLCPDRPLRCDLSRDLYESFAAKK